MSWKWAHPSYVHETQENNEGIFVQRDVLAQETYERKGSLDQQPG